MRFGLVAGEESGDILGASLVRCLKQRFPHAVFDGIGGKRMISEGFHSLFPLERLSVMGFIEPLKRLPELLRMRSAIINHFTQSIPDVYIGIDAPDFNLNIEKNLRSKNIKTAHFVSPTVWAWRKGRIKNIKKSVDLMLTLFPFETEIYRDNKIPCVCVGHPLADTIPMVSDQLAAREELQLPTNKKIVALLPGSRQQELKYLARPFVQTAKWLYERDKTLEFITACPNSERETQFKAVCVSENFTNIKIFNGQATSVMKAADAILLASGTASLEAMLVKRPTVVAYIMSPITFMIAKRLIKVPYIALPNLLAKKEIMPEFIQDQATPEALGTAVLNYLNNNINIYKEFEKIHVELKKNSGEMAANAIAELIEGKL